jgi:hypothetical protein
MSTYYPLALLLFAVAAGAALAYRRLSHIEHLIADLRKTIRKDIDTAEVRLYRQLESLESLNNILKPRVPLPSLREWAGSPDFLLELTREILARRPETIVECSSGASTVVAARCCELSNFGHVLSLENSPEFAEKTRRLLVAAGLQGWATVINAPLKSYAFEGQNYNWYSIDELPDTAIDMLIIDGPLGKLNEQARYPAGPMLIPRLTSNGIVMLDDSNRLDERKIVERWQAEFPGFLSENRDAEKGLTILTRPNASPIAS